MWWRKQGKAKSVSLDLRTLLTLIMGYLRLLKEVNPISAEELAHLFERF